MGAVVDLSERRAQVSKDSQALAGPVICHACGHEWHAVAETGVTALECPECHSMKGAWKCFILPAGKDGEKKYLWTCIGCGEQLFSITPSKDGPLLCCAGCGSFSKAMDVFE